MDLRKQYWWKILAVCILLYVFVRGLLTPLNPGILEVTPYKANAGERQTFTVNTYNTRFEEGASIHAYIKLDSVHLLPASQVKVVGDTQLEVTFDIPMFLPTDKKTWSYPLILSDTQNGAFVRPAVLSIAQNTIDPKRALLTWDYPSPTLHQADRKGIPFRAVIYETIRNTYFHVPLWFGMVLLFMASMIHSVRYLRTGQALRDLEAEAYTKVGVLFGILGCVTGALWAKNTWGTWWTFAEIKLNMSAIAMLIYLAYFVLRHSFEDEEKRARVSAVYNIFAFFATIPLLFVIPRMVDGSLHPGNGGNPGFGGDDLDNQMRMVFYPAIIGWTLLGVWMATLLYRMERLWYKLLDDE